MKEIERIIENILMGGKDTSLLEKEKAEDILLSLISVCGSKKFYEGDEVAKVLDVAGDRIVREAISLKLKDIDKMLGYLNELDHSFSQGNRTRKYSAAQLNLILKLTVLKGKKK